MKNMYPIGMLDTYLRVIRESTLRTSRYFCFLVTGLALCLGLGAFSTNAFAVTLTGSDSPEDFWVDNNDIVYGNGGDDKFYAQRSYIQGAVIYAGPGNDVVILGNWRDLVAYGGAGNDTLSGGYVSSYLDGGDGDDTFVVEKGVYTIYGGSGNDVIRVNLPTTEPIVHVPEWDPANTAKLENSTIHGGDGSDSLIITADEGASAKIDYGNGFIDVTITYLTNKVVTIRAYDVESVSLNGWIISPAPQNYSDSWWNSNESGWGITITDHGTKAFVQWYTYDQTGHNQKYVISGGTFSSDKCQLIGVIQHVTGPSWTSPTFDPNQVTRTIVGTGTFDFCPVGLPAGTAVFNYSVDQVRDSKQLTRLQFGNDVPHWGGTANTGTSDFTDLWWNPSESGWGVSITQHGDNIFFRIFTYDTDGRPILFVVPGVTFNNSATSFTGTVTLTSGPWFGSNPFDPNQVVRATAGSATITFSDANNGVLTYTVNGITKTKSITRMVF